MLKKIQRRIDRSKNPIFDAFLNGTLSQTLDRYGSVSVCYLQSRFPDVGSKLDPLIDYVETFFSARRGRLSPEDHKRITAIKTSNSIDRQKLTDLQAALHWIAIKRGRSFKLKPIFPAAAPQPAVQAFAKRPHQRLPRIRTADHRTDSDPAYLPPVPAAAGAVFETMQRLLTERKSTTLSALRKSHPTVAAGLERIIEDLKNIGRAKGVSGINCNTPIDEIGLTCIKELHRFKSENQVRLNREMPKSMPAKRVETNVRPKDWFDLAAEHHLKALAHVGDEIIQRDIASRMEAIKIAGRKIQDRRGGMLSDQDRDIVNRDMAASVLAVQRVLQLRSKGNVKAKIPYPPLSDLISQHTPKGKARQQLAAAMIFMPSVSSIPAATTLNRV